MSIGTSPNDVGFVILLLLGCLLVPVILIAIGGLIARILGFKSGTFQLVFMLVILVGAVVGGSLYLDTAGRAINGLVIEKEERVRLRKEGDWRQEFQAGVVYRQDGERPETTYLAEGDSSTSLNLGAAQFDTLRKGAPVALKVLPIWRSLTLVRLANTSTREWIPWNWLAIGLGVIALIWLAFKIGRSRVGCLVIFVLGASVAIGLLTSVIYREWRAMEDLSAKPLRAEATIREVTRITRIDPLPCRGGCRNNWDTEFDVPQQYDIVQLAFTPQGGRDEVLAVDAADAGLADLAPERTIAVAYAAANPRAAQIIGATHAHHWRNMVAFVEISLGFLLAIGLFLLLVGWLGTRFKRAKTP